MDRKPVVAGQFYPGSRNEWEPMVRSYLDAEKRSSEQSILSMVPHAGYIFSGSVAGKTIQRAGLSETVIMLGPNHTGRGASMALWPDGSWNVPGASIKVDEGLSHKLLEAVPQFTKDYVAHQDEHSLEVMIPFLWAVKPSTTIVPLCISEYDLNTLEKAGRSLAEVISGLGHPVSILVSSDMSHFITHDQATSRDKLALDKIMELDPAGLFETVRKHGISMCGILPMTMGLYAALELGAGRAELVQYTTSGEVSGDYAQVVGYAGVVVS